MGARFRLCKARVTGPGDSQTRMLASMRMRAARELLSPLTLALVLCGAALFFAQDPGDSRLPWLGIAALVLAGVLFATRSPPDGLIGLVPLGALALWCAISIAWSLE